MNNRKFYFFIGGILVFLLLVYSLYLAFKDSQKQPVLPQNKVQLPSSKGPPVEVNNFLNKPKEKLSYGAVLAETEKYKIIYFSEDEGMLITLKQKPLSEAQNLAENELIRQLGVDKQTACSLKIFIGIPFQVDEALAGKNYIMSFCTGGKVF